MHLSHPDIHTAACTDCRHALSCVCVCACACGVVYDISILFFTRPPTTDKKKRTTFTSRSVCMCLSSALANCALKQGAHHDALNHCADGLNLAVTSSVPAAHATLLVTKVRALVGLEQVHHPSEVRKGVDSSAHCASMHVQPTTTHAR